MLVPCLVAVGTILDGRLVAAPSVLLWFVTGLATSYAVLFSTFFLLGGRRWAGGLLVLITLLLLPLVDLPLCWALLGVDGLVRDSGPLVVAATIALHGLWRAGRARWAGSADPAGVARVDVPAEPPTPAPAR